MKHPECRDPMVESNKNKFVHQQLGTFYGPESEYFLVGDLDNPIFPMLVNWFTDLK